MVTPLSPPPPPPPDRIGVLLCISKIWLENSKQCHFGPLLVTLFNVWTNIQLITLTNLLYWNLQISDPCQLPGGYTVAASASKLGGGAKGAKENFRGGSEQMYTMSAKNDIFAILILKLSNLV